MSDQPNDYLGAITEAPKDMLQYGVKGMQWGVRRDRSTLRKAAAQRSGAKKSTEKKEGSSSKSGSSGRKGDIQDKVETSQERYAKLAAQAKAGQASAMTEADLKFFNARTEALNKVKKMNETKPGWLQETTKTVLQQAAQKQMQSVADGLADKYIGAPITKAIKGKKD